MNDFFGELKAGVKEEDEEWAKAVLSSDSSSSSDVSDSEDDLLGDLSIGNNTIKEEKEIDDEDDLII